MQALESGSKGRLTVDSVTNIGPHYARTLREWRRRFLEKFDSHIAPALMAEHADVMSGPRGLEELEVFKKKWICECFHALARWNSVMMQICFLFPDYL